MHGNVCEEKRLFISETVQKIRPIQFIDIILTTRKRKKKNTSNIIFRRIRIIVWGDHNSYIKYYKTKMSGNYNKLL